MNTTERGRRKKAFWAGGLIVLVVAFGVFLEYHFQLSSPTNPATIAAPASSSLAAEAGQTTTSRLPRDPPIVESEKSASSMFASAGDFPEAYRYLTTRSRDPDAPYFAREMARICRGLYDSASGRFLELEESDPQHASGEVTQRRVIAQRILVSRCNGWQGKMPTSAELKELGAQATLKNGPAGKAALIFDLIQQGRTEESHAITKSILVHQTGYAFDLLATDLVSRFGDGWAIGERGERVPPELIQPLLLLTGCDFGADCGTDTTPTLIACVNASVCVENVEELAMRYPGVNPGATEALPHFRAVLADAIRRNRLDLLSLGG